MTKRLLIISARYGAIAGVLAFILLIVLYHLGPHPLLTSPFLDFRILLFGIFVFFTLKEFRDFNNNGVLHFSQAMFGGLSVVLKSFPKEDISRIGKEIYERNLAALPATNVFDLIQTYFMQGIVIGFFVNIILSVILRRQPKP